MYWCSTCMQYTVSYLFVCATWQTLRANWSQLLASIRRNINEMENQVSLELLIFVCSSMLGIA